MIKVALAAPLQLYRLAYARAINSTEGYCVVCEAASGEELIQYIRQSGPPEVVLLNLEQAGMNVYATATWLHGNHPHIKILVISMYNHEVVIARFLQTGIRAFLKMEVGLEELQKALRHVAEDDGLYVGGNDGKLLLVIGQFGNRAALDKLSLSEQEIFFIRLVCSPDSMDEIADKMDMPRRTCYHFMEALFKKLGVKTRVGIAVWAERNGVLHL
jgi:DNA-binding NarL/FixJ family response regulator